MASPAALSAPADSGLVRAAGRPAERVAFEVATVDFFVSAAELLGVPKSLAAIYGIVFASPAPLSFADIEARLNLSKGSVSQGLRALRDVGALQEVSKPEDPAELFTPDLEMRRLIGRYLESRVDPRLKCGSERIKELYTHCSFLLITDQKLLSTRLRKLHRWQTRLIGLVPVVRVFLGIGYTPKQRT